MPRPPSPIGACSPACFPRHSGDGRRDQAAAAHIIVGSELTGLIPARYARQVADRAGACRYEIPAALNDQDGEKRDRETTA